jgi:hypothetical protein
MAITKIQSESLNLADTYAFTGTVTGAGESNRPYFLATITGGDQDIGYTGVYTKITMNNEVFDSDNAYDTSTYRFTPQTAGKYFVHSVLQFEATAGSNQVANCRSVIYKNGSYQTGWVIDSDARFQGSANFVGKIIDMNGSTDYLECYAVASELNAGSTRVASGTTSSFFGAYLISTT